MAARSDLPPPYYYVNPPEYTPPDLALSDAEGDLILRAAPSDAKDDLMLSNAQSEEGNNQLEKFLEKFSEVEREFMERGTGAFEDPANRAFSYRIVIDQLLESEQPQEARNRFNEALWKNVWNPVADRSIKLLCDSQCTAAQNAIGQAEAQS